MTVYLILPADRLETFGRWLRLLIQQAITVNARNIGTTPTKPVLFLLDEMAALGRLSMVEQAFGLMAGFGIQLWGIVQDLSQLERIYDKGWQTFISNSGVIQYFGSRDKITAEYFSTLCGVTTIRIQSFTYALGRTLTRTWGTVTGAGGGSSNEGGSDGTSHTHSIGTNESQRQLAYPDELMVLKNDSQILFIENFDPVQGQKLPWYKDENLRALGVNLRAELPNEQPKKQIASAATRVAETPKAAEARKQTAQASAPAQSEPQRTGEDAIYDDVFGMIAFETYSDGTVVFQTSQGRHRVASKDALLGHLEKAKQNHLDKTKPS